MPPRNGATPNRVAQASSPAGSGSVPLPAGTQGETPFQPAAGTAALRYFRTTVVVPKDPLGECAVRVRGVGRQTGKAVARRGGALCSPPQLAAPTIDIPARQANPRFIKTTP